MDLVTFNRDVFFSDNQDEAVFEEGKEYEILGENKDFIFVCTKPNTNECSQIPKSEEGTLFEYK